MSWLSAIGLLLKIADGLMAYARDKRLIDGAVAERMLVHTQGALDEIRAAQKVKTEVDARTSGPDASAKLRDDPANLYRD